MITDALDASTGSLDALAAEIGVSYDTLWAWRAGRRTPSPANMKRLAAALAERGVRLMVLADDISAAAEREG